MSETSQEESNAPIVFLRGKRLYMRPVQMSDLHQLQQFVNDPDIRRLVGNQYPQSEISEKEFIERISKHKECPTDIVLGIVDIQNDKLIGIMGVHHINWRNRVGSSGTIIGEKDYWGIGYGTEAKMLFLNYVFNTLNLRKIYSEALAFNERSLGFNAKCGYKVEGVCKQDAFVDGEYIDIVLTAVFRDDFLPLWEKYRRNFLS